MHFSTLCLFDPHCLVTPLYTSSVFRCCIFCLFVSSCSADRLRSFALFQIIDYTPYHLNHFDFIIFIPFTLCMLHSKWVLLLFFSKWTCTFRARCVVIAANVVVFVLVYTYQHKKTLNNVQHPKQIKRIENVGKKCMGERKRRAKRRSKKKYININKEKMKGNSNNNK